MGKVKIFICYSAEDKDIGGQIKNYLESYLGFEVFCAYRNLQISDDFHLEIIKNLIECDVFIPLISKSLLKSFFANQEIGFSVGNNKVIMPISTDGTNPYGLIDHKHAQKCDGSNQSIFIITTDISAVLVQNIKYKYLSNKVMNSFVYALFRSSSWRMTSIILNLIIQSHSFIKLNEKHIKEIIKAARSNENIYQADLIMIKLNNFLQKNYNITVDF